MSDKKMNRAMSRIRAMETAYAATLEAERVAIFGTEDKERSIILRAQDAVDHAIKELYEIADPYADSSPNNPSAGTAAESATSNPIESHE